MRIDGFIIRISIENQILSLIQDEQLIKKYTISTAQNGPGELKDSECTPRGQHMIKELIGDSCIVNTVFVGRKETGEIYTPEMRTLHPQRDWILTRIIRLEGCEDGVNKGGNVDSFDRYIYIHGAPDDVEMGKPGSHGCIRMRNADILELYDNLELGMPVMIHE
jgi:lipoprotein-anchoring transpeptidase ErfK/SrfK